MNYFRIFGFVIVFCFLSVIAARAESIKSLNDLPFQWEGIAGDLVTRVPATFTINRILNVKHSKDSSLIRDVYDIEAVVKFGERSVVVKQMELSFWKNREARRIFDFTIYMEDELSPDISGIILYDEAAKLFTLKDLSHAGIGKRFFFQARKVEKKHL